MMAHNDISEEQLAGDVDVRWNLVAAELEYGVIDEAGDYVGGEIDCESTIAWMDAHLADFGPESREPFRKDIECLRGSLGSAY